MGQASHRFILSRRERFSRALLVFVTDTFGQAWPFQNAYIRFLLGHPQAARNTSNPLWSTTPGSN
ncbi:hypothetical protein NSND_61750 [Nitrospira sp. ND1]|nr:hypothetical protein NSND_61750 [Nitrospira sp. ND1]